MKGNRLTIATRGSELALWQSSHIKSRLERLHPHLQIDQSIIKTTGDKILDSPLSRIGDKGLFTKEIEQSLLDESADLAVHSLKDIPTVLPKGLRIAAVTEREDVRDVFVARAGSPSQSLHTLPQGSAVATGSLRRRCQLLRLRKDLRITDVRGNLATRLRKLDESDWSGMILARAGMIRLGWSDRMTEVLDFDVMLPAVGQGALGLEIREDDDRLAELIAPLQHEPTAVAITSERALLRRLEGGCQIPIGAHGRLQDGTLFLDALIGSLDGTRIVRGSIHGDPRRAESLGNQLAETLLQQGGEAILREIRSQDAAGDIRGSA